MKKLLSASALLALMGSSSLFAANFKVPMEFEYLALDGKKVSTSLFRHKADLDLTQGEHKIALRYSDMIDDDFNDSQSSIESKPFIITINVDGDYNYKLLPIDGEFVKNPQAFSLNPQVVVTREDRGHVSYSVTHTDIEEKNFLSRLVTGETNEKANKSIETVTTTQPMPVAATAVVVPTVVASTTPAPKAPIADAKNTGARSEQMLQYWWSQADEKTRKEFMSWAIKQL